MGTMTDNFTDTSGTLLSAHTTDSAHTWVLGPSATGTMSIHTSGTEAYGNATARYYSTFVPATADYTITMVISAITSGDVSEGILARMSTTDQTYYWFFWHSGNARWELRQYVSGTPSDLDTYSGDSPIGATPMTMTVEITDAAKILKINGVTRINYTATNTITAAGRPGIVGGDNGTADRVDSYVVTEAAGGSAALPGTDTASVAETDVVRPVSVTLSIQESG